QRGDSLSVSVSLIDVRDGSELWGKPYERKLLDILPLQDEIAKDIATNLRLHLTGDEERRLTKRDTDNANAYHLYLKGRYFWNKRTIDGLNRGIESFRQAIDKDPSYALAHVGLADCYALLAQGDPPRAPKEVFPLSKAHALEALKLDDTLAEAHATLGFIRTNFEWDWQGAEQEYRRAIELNASYPTAHHWYAILLGAMGRLDDAVAQLSR